MDINAIFKKCEESEKGFHVQLNEEFCNLLKEREQKLKPEKIEYRVCNYYNDNIICADKHFIHFLRYFCALCNRKITDEQLNMKWVEPFMSPYLVNDEIVLQFYIREEQISYFIKGLKES